MSVLSLNLPPAPQSAGAAREGIRQLLEAHGCKGAGCEEPLVVVSELVTNAIAHARSTIRVEAVLRYGDLCVRVTDDSHLEPERREPSADGVGGWGLNLVELLGRDWGFGPREDGEPGKTVWARLPLEH